MKSLASEGTSETLLFIKGIHMDITKIHDELSKLRFSMYICIYL